MRNVEPNENEEMQRQLFKIEYRREYGYLL
jgi:hypothetical protein